MKELLSYTKKYKKESILAPFFKALEVLFSLLIPIMVSNIIDNIKTASDKKNIFLQFLIMLLLSLLGFITAITAQYFAAKAASGFAGDLRFALFKKINTFSYLDLDKFQENTLITRIISDVDTVQTGYNMFLRLLLRSPLVVLGAVVMTYFIDTHSGNIILLTIPVLFITVFIITKISLPLITKSRKKLDTLTTITKEHFYGARVIRAFNAENSEEKIFNTKNQELTELLNLIGKISSALNPLTFGIINIATIILIKYGGISVSNGAITQGNVVAIYNYMAQMAIELIKLASLIITINKAFSCSSRIAEILKITPSVQYPYISKSSNINADIILEFKNVSFSYSESKSSILENISFNIKKGQKLGIIGGTGAGKSTLINLISRFYDVKSGKIIINGNDIKSYSKNDLNKLISIVPQNAVLFEGTIKDNIIFGNENADKTTINTAISISQSEEFIKTKPDGLNSIVEQDGRNFSGGQKQRLCIARALAKKPEILILDDSSSAIDTATNLKIHNALNKISKSLVLIIVSQRITDVMDCNMILVLDDGKTVGYGTHNELLKECKIYNEIYLSQKPIEVHDE
ncbi:MAG: ABC transporter ATP-binding protein [Candidatus Fimenecus sp.]